MSGETLFLTLLTEILSYILLIALIINQYSPDDASVVRNIYIYNHPALLILDWIIVNNPVFIILSARPRIELSYNAERHPSHQVSLLCSRNYI